MLANRQHDTDWWEVPLILVNKLASILSKDSC